MQRESRRKKQEGVSEDDTRIERGDNADFVTLLALFKLHTYSHGELKNENSLHKVFHKLKDDMTSGSHFFPFLLSSFPFSLLPSPLLALMMGV